MKLKHIIPASLSIITLIFIFIFRHNPQLVENYYSNAFYPVIASILSNVSRIFPFSLSDIFYLLLIVWLIYSLILVIIKKLKFKQFAINLLITIAYILSLFHILWGFNYNRADIFTRTQLSKIKEDNTDIYKKTLKQLINEANNNYLSADFIPSTKYIDKSIEHSFKENAELLSITYPCGKRRVKSITLSLLFAKSGILGYFGPFFNEVQICSKLTKWDIPMVMAHEKAHQFGVTSEGEANFYAWLVCSTSECRWNRYSASVYAISMFLNKAKGADYVKKLAQDLLPRVKKDIIMRNNYWRSIRNKHLGSMSNFINDAYLKGNNVEKGVDDYGTMIDLIVAYKNR